MGAALAMAECTAGVVSASGAEKPPLRHPRGWSGRRMARQGVRAEGHCKARLALCGIEPRHRNGRARKRPVSWKESDWVRVTHELRVAEGGICQDTERKRQSEDSPVVTVWGPQSKRHARMTVTLRWAQGGDCRGRTLSGHRKKVRVREAHLLETAEGRVRE